ncbi:hypothetical protein U3A58_04965 [Algoriphagus sp. C2-6-M1]|uniref:hypothetical protein n=1 Tax=Algoriphagus persicinus TaxID=3108754 RepID=UPI002B3B0C92|nr:hypothetical protein [Algoriphagus sp. C2-6-M1]MEB2779736.1 hypothetical protein [Algoriphagus sp. C2-6-M1]
MDQIKTFQVENQDEEEFRLECQYQIGFIYWYNEMHQKSMDILLPLVSKREKIEDFQFSNMLLVILKSLSKLRKLGQAKEIFERFIDDRCINNFYQIEGMLLWYVEALDPAESQLRLYQHKLRKLMKGLGYYPEKVTFKDQILAIKEVHLKVNRQFSEISLDYRKEPKAVTLQRLNDFILSNPPKFYRGLANEFKSKIEAKIKACKE